MCTHVAYFLVDVCFNLLLQQGMLLSLGLHNRLYALYMHNEQLINPLSWELLLYKYRIIVQ